MRGCGGKGDKKGEVRRTSARGRGVVCSYALLGRFELSPRRSSLPVRRRSIIHPHPSHPFLVSINSHSNILPAFAEIKMNTACKQRDEKNENKVVSLCGGGSRDVKWSLGMAINRIQIVLITVQQQYRNIDNRTRARTLSAPSSNPNITFLLISAHT